MSALKGAAFKVVADIDKAKRKLADLEQKRVPQLLVNATNDVAFGVRSTLRGVIVTRFNEPTPYTVNSVFVDKATDAKPIAIVKLRDEATKGTPPVKYLEPNVRAKRRRRKRFEEALERAGFLAPGEYAIPAVGARRDRYGNVPATEIVRMLSQLRAFGEQGYKANATGSARSKAKRRVNAYFFVRDPKGGLLRGIWQRTPAGARPVFVFVQGAPKYVERFPFGEIATRQARIEWPIAIAKRAARMRASLNR